MESDNHGQPSNQGSVEISLSIEDTNKLRAKLGLRPLRVDSSKHELEKNPVERREREGSSLQVKDRIEKTRRKRIESSILAPRSIAAAVLTTGESEENGSESDDDPALWVEKMRNRRNKASQHNAKEAHVKEKGGKKNSKNIQHSEDTLIGIKVDHAEEEIARNERTILTLKDTNVLMDVDDGDEEREVVLQSIDILQRNEKKPQQSADPCAPYDPTDNREFVKNAQRDEGKRTLDNAVEKKGLRIQALGTAASVEDGRRSGASAGTAASKKSSIAEQLSLSIALEEKHQFQEDYDVMERSQRGFARRRKTKHGKSKKRKRRIEAELRDALNEDRTSTMVASGKLPPKPPSRAASIRSKAMDDPVKEEDEEDEDGMDSILHASLRRAREKAKSSNMDASVKRILKIIDEAQENEGKDGDDVDNGSANLIFTEIEHYVRNIPAADPIEGESSPDGKDMDVDVKQIGEDNKKPLDVLENSSKASVTEDGDVISKPSDSAPEVPAPASTASTKLSVDSAELRVADMGVAGALARFRAMGDLRNRPQQQGRARDERIDWKELDSKVPVPGGQRNIKLSYTDESGRELTPKEAFRLMCHKFHGKGPSKNKRELRLRRQLQQMREQQMAIDDTPLGSTSALRDETRRTGVAHVVLSGPSVAPLGSALEQSSLGKGKKSMD